MNRNITPSLRQVSQLLVHWRPYLFHHHAVLREPFLGFSEECHTRCSLSQRPLDKSSVGREDLVYGGDAIDKFGPFCIVGLA